MRAAAAVPVATVVTSAVNEGYFDYAGCDNMYGWAWDSSRPDTAISVDILDGSDLLRTITANDYRPDLPGNKNHAFNYTTPSSLKDGRTHAIYVRFSGTSTYLTNSPRSITCAPPPPTISGYSWDTTPAPNQPFSGTITGSGFVSGTQVFFCVSGTNTCYQHPSAGVTVNSLTRLGVSNVSLGAGSYQIYVQTSSGQSARSTSFTVQAPTPTISGYSWNTTPVASQSFGGTINGTGFAFGIQVFFCVNGTGTCYEHPSAGINVNSSTSISLSNVNLGGGSYQVYVQTSAGQSARSAAFNVLAPPTVGGYSWGTTPTPNQPFGGTITGTGFVSGVRVFFCVNGTPTCYEHPSAGVSVNSSTSLSLANVNLGAGSYQIYVQTAAGQSARSTAFTVQQPAAAISGYTWSTTPTANQFFGGTITGSGFVAGTRVFFCVNGTTTCYEHPQAGIRVNTSTSLSVANVSLGGGSWQFYVQTPAGQSVRSTAFTVQSTPPPVVSSISPAVPVSSGSDQNITVSGGNFQQNLTVSVTFPGGGGGTLGGTQIQNVTPTSFVMRITVGAPGAWVMRVNNPDGTQSAPFNFTVQSAVQPPAVSGLNPATPSAAATDQDVLVFGSNFQQNLTVTATFPNGGTGTLSGAQVQNVTPTSFVLRITLGAAGGWSIRINNPDGGQSSPFGFSVSQGVQGVTVSSLNPSSPTASGADQNVVVNGGNFQQGLRVNVTFPNGGVGTLHGTGQIQNVTPNSFVMRITVNAPGAWLMRVVNPDGTQSAQFPFTVQVVGPAPTGLPTSVLSPVLGPLRVTTTNLATRDGRWEFNQYKSGYHTPTGGISLSNDTYAWDVNLYTETSGNADAGKAVYAVADGEVVTYVGTPPGGGPGAVLIAHPNRTSPVWFSGYLHMTNVRVALHQAVSPTTLLGDVGRVSATNDHLHFVVYSGQNTRGNLQSFNVVITERSTLSASPPTISGVSPSAVNQANELQTITISGANFLNPVIEVQDPNGQYFTIAPEPLPGLQAKDGIAAASDTSITARIPFRFSGTYTLSVINRSAGTTAAAGGGAVASAQSGSAAFVASDSRSYESYPTGSRTPVIIIPGIMGSRIGTRITGNIFSENFPGLPLETATHLGLRNNINFGNPIDQRPVIATDIFKEYLGFKDIYGTLIDTLTGPYRGYKMYKANEPNDRTSAGCDLGQKGANLFIFPYDWRSTNEQSARDLKDFVDCVTQIAPNGSDRNFKFDIIAHSMGGLVARRYILEGLYGTWLNYDPKVRKMVTLGTPWLGAPKFILALETGEAEGISTGVRRLMFQKTLKEVSRYMPGAHELIPSPAYTDELRDTNSGDFPFGENGWDFNGSRSTERIYSFSALEALMNRHSPDGVIKPGTNTKVFHSKQYQGKMLQDNWTGDQTGVTYYNFIGRCLSERGELNTIGSVIATSEWYQRLGVWHENRYLATKMTRGDCTVPEISAMRQSGKGNYLGPAIPKVFENVEHGAMPNDQRIIAAIDCLFSGGDSLTCFSGSTTAGPEETSSASTPTYGLKVLGATAVVISDSFGNTTNPLSTSSDEGVATVLTTVTGEDSLSAVVPLDQNYKVFLKTSASPLVVVVTRNEGEVTTAAVRYLDLSVPPDVTALLELTPQGVSVLRYDGNGDGTFETTVTPTASVTGAQAQDIEPPALTFAEVAQGATTQVTLTASDAGTGVRQIMYSLDRRGYQPYTAPIALDPMRTPTVYAFADDNVANRSGLQTFHLTGGALRIDSVTPRAGRTTGGQQIRLTGSFVNLSAVTVGGASASWNYVNGSINEITVTTPPHAVGAASINLTPTAGSALLKPNAFAYLPITFTDNVLVAGVTAVKGQYFTEVRQAVDALRAVVGLAPAVWTDPLLPGVTIRAIHVREIRDRLEETQVPLGLPPFTYTDPNLAPGTVIKRVHLEELRQRIRNIAG